jgi:hypothetical protein
MRLEKLVKTPEKYRLIEGYLNDSPPPQTSYVLVSPETPCDCKNQVFPITRTDRLLAIIPFDVHNAPTSFCQLIENVKARACTPLAYPKIRADKPRRNQNTKGSY